MGAAKRSGRPADRRALADPVDHRRAGFAVWNGPIEPSRDDAPVSGGAICDGLKLFHDASQARFGWRQVGPKAAPALKLVVYQFDGRYISLAAGLPGPIASAFGPGRRVELVQDVRVSRPLGCFLRMNLTSEGRHEVLHEAFVLADGPRRVVFDPGGLPITFGQGLSAWIDIILSEPAMSEIELRRLEISLMASEAGS